MSKQEKPKKVECECVEPILAINDQIAEYVDRYCGLGYEEKPPEIKKEELRKVVDAVFSTVREEVAGKCGVPVPDEDLNQLSYARQEAEKGNVKTVLEVLRDVAVNVQDVFYKTKCMEEKK